MSLHAEIVADGVLQHHGFRDVPRQLAEWRDMLAPGGRLKIAVPDLEWHIERWLAAPESRRWSSRLHALFGFQNGPQQTQLTGFTAPRLHDLLTDAGFDIELLTWTWHRAGRGIWVEAARSATHTSRRQEIVPLAAFASQFTDPAEIPLVSREEVRRFLAAPSIAIEGMHIQALVRSEYGLLIDCVLRSPVKRMIAFALPLYGSAENPRLELPGEWIDASDDLRTRILERAQQTLLQVAASGSVDPSTGSVTVGYDLATPWPPPGNAIVAGATPYTEWLPLLKRHLLAAELANGGRVLTIGTAVAFGAHVLARSAALVDAIEWSGDNLGHIRRFVTPSNIRWIAGDPKSLPLRGEHYDVITAAAGIDDHESFAKQAVRLLRPGGFLVVSTICAQSATLRAVLRRHFDEENLELLGQTRWSADVDPEGQAVLSRRVTAEDESVVAVCRRPAPKAVPAIAPVQKVPRDAVPPIIWCAPFLNSSGFGEEARASAAGLAAMGCRVLALPYGHADPEFLAGLDAAERVRLQTLMSTSIEDEDAIFVCHGLYMLDSADELATIGRFVFETDGLPPGRAELWNRVDEIWVASEFNRETFTRAGIDEKKIRVVPEAVDVHSYAPDVEPLTVPGRRAFAFLSVFVWQTRKGWDVLIRAFVEEFRAEDDVCLMLRVITFSGTTRDEVRANVNALVAEVATRSGISRTAVPPILLLFEPIAGELMPRLYRAADAYVGAHRGEGWGRPLMEAMASGIPTIATRWSGNLAFMNDDNSWLVEIEGLVDVPPTERIADFRGQRWAEPSVASLRQQMRTVFRDRSAAAAKARRARAEMVEKYSRPAVGALVLERLRDFVQRVPSIRAARNIVRRAGAIEGRFEGEFSSVHGLSRVNRELSRALLTTGRCDLALFETAVTRPFDLEGDEWREVRANLGRSADRPAFVIRHHWPPNFRGVRSKRLVVILPWELGRVPRAWVEYIGKTVNEVWVPTRFVRDAFLDSGADPDRVFVVPNGVSASRFHPAAEPRRLPTAKTFRFLFVGGAIARKGFDVLLAAYREAFTSADDVTLILKRVGDDLHYRGQSMDRELTAMRADPRAPEVIEVRGELTDAQMAGLYTSAHCLVHPYRGEGFALPVAEAMACALPAIVTRGGACDDWCDDSCAWMIPATKAPVRSTIETVGPPWMLDPDRDALVALLQAAVVDREATRARGQRARQVVQARLTWERAADIALARLHALV
jgi:glycosyltransferase involved in cell wall biosynthesis/SAM-dependent methyltransferase